VFRAKLEELRRRLLYNDILGKVKAYVYVVEFQKRGLSHAHRLLIMQRKFKITCPEQYDMIISAELPNKEYPELYKMVTKHMMHGPCGALKPSCPCTKDRTSSRTITRDHSVIRHRKARIRTQGTGGVMMVVRKWFEVTCWTIDGLSCTTRISCVLSTATLM
jgi:hypothetical protein